MGLIDTHCHFEMLKASAADVLADAREAGVDVVLAIGTDLRSSRAAVELAGRHDEVFAVVGMHPHDAVHFDGVVRTGLQHLLAHPKAVAVGECGLDFYRDHSPRDVQRAAFIDQLGLARAVGSPVVVHTREAAGETFAILTEHAEGLTVVLHCFTATDFIDLCNERGYYLAFAGNLTYKNADDLRLAARQAREDRLLVETDAPYLTPEPQRGRENRPAKVAYTAALLAQLRGLEPAALAEITSANARRAFRLPATG
jgi:TatD DNase family protein